MIDGIKLLRGDCLELMQEIPDGSIDLILCDLPYGTTSSRWDKVLPMDKLWEQYTRIIKYNCAIVLFGAEPFSSEIRIFAKSLYKYDWVWIKNNAVGFTNAKLKPMPKHENIMVFSKGKTANGSPDNMPYFPQGLVPYGKEMRSGNKEGKDNTYWRPSLKSSNEGGYIQQYTNYPTTVLHFPKDGNRVHPTQKPVPLLEYLVKTYTNPGEMVLDNCMGSGSTGVACVRTGRKFIGIEKDPGYFEIAKKRITEEPAQLQLML